MSSVGVGGTSKWFYELSNDPNLCRKVASTSYLLLSAIDCRDEKNSGWDELQRKRVAKNVN